MGREKEQVEYKRLFSPIEINGMAVKNRIVEAPIQLAYCKDGHVNERIKLYFEKSSELTIESEPENHRTTVTMRIHTINS